MGPEPGTTPTADATSRWRLLIRHRFGFQAGVDAAAWAVAIVAATLLRYEFDYQDIDWAGLALIVPVAIVIHVVVGTAGGLYLGRWRFGSFEAVATLAPLLKKRPNSTSS